MMNAGLVLASRGQARIGQCRTLRARQGHGDFEMTPGWSCHVTAGWLFACPDSKTPKHSSSRC